MRLKLVILQVSNRIFLLPNLQFLLLNPQSLFPTGNSCFHIPTPPPKKQKNIRKNIPDLVKMQD